MESDEALDDELTTAEVDLSNFKLNANDLFRGQDFQIMTNPPANDENDDVDESTEKSKPSYKAELKRMYDLLTGSFDGQSTDRTIHDLRSDFAEYKRKMEDISPQKTGAVCKRILRQGVGDVVGGSKIVKFHYSLFAEGQDEPFDSSRFRNRMKKVKLGTGALLIGMDIAVGTMKQGELADFIIESEYAFKEYGCPPRVPPDCTILAEVELLEWTDDDDTIDTMTLEQREKLPIEEVRKYVEKKLSLGKSLFSKEKFNAACNRYNEARLQLQIFHSNKNSNTLEEMRFRVYKNLVLCYLKLDLLEKASNNLDILELTNPNDVKILYLRTKILFKRGNYSEALKTARKAQNFAPTNTELMRLIIQIERCRKEYERQLKEQARRMFSGSLCITSSHVKTSVNEAETSKNETEYENVSEKFKHFVQGIVHRFRETDDKEYRFERYSFTAPELLYIQSVADKENISLEACDLQTEGCYMKFVK